MVIEYTPNSDFRIAENGLFFRRRKIFKKHFQEK